MAFLGSVEDDVQADESDGVSEAVDPVGDDGRAARGHQTTV